MSDHGTILYDETQAPIARVTLTRPDRRTAITPQMCDELVCALGRAGENAAVRVVVLTGAGSVFCAGADLGEIGGLPAGAGRRASLVDLLASLHALHKPIVAMVNGHALAGGLGLMVACDVVVAAADAEMGLPEINVGVWPMIVGAEIVRSVGRKKALDLMLTGRRVTAAEAERIGLVTRVAPRARLEEETLALARELAEKSPTAIRMGLEAFYDTEDMALRPALDDLQRRLAALLGTDDAAEGLAAFREKRAPVWKGR